MDKLQFNIYFCGMSEETFSEQIMIYKPNSCIVKSFTKADLRDKNIVRVGELIDALKKDMVIRESLGSWALDNFTISTVYIKYRNCLLGLQKDKPILEVFRDFDTHQLEFAYFAVGGGASIHNETSYRFTVHPNEKIHEHMPHVHVLKAGVEIRYSLETLQPIDPLVNPHRRDNKKIIMPFLHQNHEQLLAMWRCCAKGYTAPEITQDGQQFYKES